MKRIFSILFAFVLAVSLMLVPAASVGASPGPGLVGLWHLDESAGTTATDSSGNGYHGTLTNMSPPGCWVSGKLGNALDFDGIDDYVQFPASNSILNTDTFTVEAWFKTSINHPVYGGTEGRIVNLHRMDTASTAVSLYVEQDKIGLLYYTGSAHVWVKHTVNYHDGAWHHIAVTHDDTDTYRLYYDGSKVAEQADAFGDFGTCPAYLGTFNSSERFFNGEIDEVRIWDTAHPPLHVDDDGAQYATPYTTITAALAVAVDGDTIIVHEGTYDEQVVITTSDLMLKGVGDTKPMITVGAGTTGAIVHVWGATDVSIVGFEIDGAGNGLAGNPASGGPATDQRFYGIRYSNASGTVRNNEVHGIKHPSGYEGVQSGVAIYAYASDVGIFNNTVCDYQKNGITTNLAGDSRIHGNTAIGWGPTDLIAQNGIQVGFGAHASVKNNTVTDNWYSGGYWAAAGVLLFEADDNSVTRNVVNANQMGVAIESWGWLQVSADNNKVTNNTISNSDVGVSIAAYYTGTADNNKVIRNTFSNNITMDISDGGTATKVHANVP